MRAEYTPGQYHIYLKEPRKALRHAFATALWLQPPWCCWSSKYSGHELDPASRMVL